MGLIPVCKTITESYSQWIKCEDHLHEDALTQVHDTFLDLMKCADDHERTVCDHATTLYESFDENSRRRADGVRTIINRSHELLDAVNSSRRVSSFARELMEVELNKQLILLRAVLKNVPKDDMALLTVEDHRKLLLDMKIVEIKRNYRLNSCGYEVPINIESLLSSRSSASELSCGETSAHDGGAVIDVNRRLIISVSGNASNGKDIFLMDIDKKTSERLRGVVPYGTHGQYPVFDGENHVFFFESESRNNDRFGYFDLETREFKELKKCPSSFREFARPCFMEGRVYVACRDKYMWVYDVAEEKWTKTDKRVGKVGMCADPFSHSIVMIKKRQFFKVYDVESKTDTMLPTQPVMYNLGSNQEMLFLRTDPENFVCIVSLDSHNLYAYVSKDKKWNRLNWRDVRNGSAHLVFDPITTTFYYKIDSERTWYSATVKLD